MGGWRRLARRLRGLLLGDDLARWKQSGLRVGRNVSIQTDVIVDPSWCWLVTLGDDVTLAPRVHILAHDASTKRALGETRIAKVTIGSRVFVGAGTIVLPGVTIGDDVVIGAGSVVTRDVPSGSVAVGNPARVVATLEDWLRKRTEERDGVPRFDGRYRSQRIDEGGKAEVRERIGGGVGYVE